jgi:uncharacterized protein YigE (DUF2233 family)
MKHVGSLFACILALAAVSQSITSPFAAAAAPGCNATDHAAARYTVCRISLASQDLRLFWGDDEGRAYGSFRALVGALDRQGLRLPLAVNAGMYHPDMAPVGLHVEGGVEKRPASTADGPGNFHLKPNGVFWIAGRTAGVAETGQFLKSGRKVDFATQSGPMLLVDGAIHPRFLPDSDSRKIRNGVAVVGGEVVFAVTETPVNFHEFAVFFRDRVGARDALFLDGTISSLHAPALGRSDSWYPLGPILGVVEPK